MPGGARGVPPAARESRGLVLLCGSSGRVTQTFHGNDLLARVLPKLLRRRESRPGLMRGIWSRIPVQDRAQGRAGHRRGGQEPARSRRFHPYLEHVTHMDLLLFLRMLQAAGDYSADDFLWPRSTFRPGDRRESDTFTPYRLAGEWRKRLPESELVDGPERDARGAAGAARLSGKRVAQFSRTSGSRDQAPLSSRGSRGSRGAQGARSLPTASLRRISSWTGRLPHFPLFRAVASGDFRGEVEVRIATKSEPIRYRHVTSLSTGWPRLSAASWCPSPVYWRCAYLTPSALRGDPERALAAP